MSTMKITDGKCIVNEKILGSPCKNEDGTQKLHLYYFSLWIKYKLPFLLQEF